ncbi:LysR family transcriptional regulator [Ramlibacter tataouinensis]|uniref:LysR family transcriptional regulator n=1 Tax=Ramlibacter tataouinensis TaxID=94132 RepID=UPI0022F3C72F|nr:LysR family transcriptional regulator [Ramlibacter tataouinensis]WBY03125.1 LysR family transcriptional regulator [Ramlibacter tataouinensis]
MALVSRALGAFVVVAEELHFGRAARRLHMSQPPLSQQIRQLEEDVGATLFTRTTRSVQLTPAGRLLLDRARRLAADADAAVKAVGRLARGEEGSLTLGFTHSTVYRVLPQVLEAFRARLPNVELELKQFTSGLLVEGVRTGRVDVALVRLSPSMLDTELRAQEIVRDRMMLLMPADHPLARLDAVPVKALEGLPFVAYSAEDSRYFHEVVERVFARHEVRPRIVHESFLPTMVALVEARMGLALVPAPAVAQREGVLTVRPLAGVEDGLDLASLHCVWRRDASNPVVRAFVEVLLQQNTAPG